MPERTTFRDSALRAVAIIGLIAILVLGAWGIIQLVVGLPDFFTRFGGGSATSTTESAGEHLTVTAPSIVTSGQPFPLSFAHTGAAGNYSFAFSYSCADGLSFAAPTPTGQYAQVPCNTPFNYINATTTTPLVAVLAQNATKQVQTTITTSATRLSDNKVTTTATTNITVIPMGQSTSPPTTQPAPTTAKPKPSSSYTPSGRTTGLYGQSDLAVRILSATPVNGRYQVQFEISNVGTNVAPTGWGFRAQLPLQPPYTYVSQGQQKMYPGDRIVYTLGFDAPQNYGYNQNMYGYPNNTCGYNQNYTYNGYYNYPNGYAYNCNPNNYGYSYPYAGNTFVVTVDPQYLISDANRANNSASANLGY